MDEAEIQRPVSRSRLSKTPSWIMLGFVLGVLGMLSLPREQPSTRIKLPPAPPPVKLERPALTEVEAVFAEWGRFAIWENDLTEVALWDTQKRTYSIFYEVLRSGDAYYFRSIPKLTRPLLPPGLAGDSPLQFTETEESRRSRLEGQSFQARPPVPAAKTGEGV